MENSYLYEKLIEKVRDSYICSPPKGLYWCDECKNQINLWSYWHGFTGNKVRILLVGQDWGSPNSKQNINVINNIKHMNAHLLANYMQDNLSITDRNLTSLFKSIGYDIISNNPKNNELFFTNFVLGYREKKKQRKL